MTYLPILLPLEACEFMPKIINGALEYPVLPPGTITPPKSDGLGWALTTLRAVFNQVNQNAMDIYRANIVICLDLNTQTKTLEITMSGYWSTLPDYVKNAWLQSVWELYTKLSTLYNVDLDYHRIELYPYNKSDEIIGYRSQFTHSIKEGITLCLQATK